MQFGLSRCASSWTMTSRSIRENGDRIAPFSGGINSDHTFGNTRNRQAFRIIFLCQGIVDQIDRPRDPMFEGIEAGRHWEEIKLD
jgi:hypothetical protein